MRPEDLSDAHLDDAVRRQPLWEPPRHFARSVLARMPPVVPAVPAPRRVFVVLRAAAVGVLGALLTYAFGLVLSSTTIALLPGAINVATAYEMFLEVATSALIEHTIVIAWVSAVVMLAIAASLTGHAEEWL